MFYVIYILSRDARYYWLDISIGQYQPQKLSIILADIEIFADIYTGYIGQISAGILTNYTNVQY